MFISSIKRWRSGLIAVAGLGSFIGWLLSVERSRNAQSALGSRSIEAQQLGLYSVIKTRTPPAQRVRAAGAPGVKGQLALAGPGQSPGLACPVVIVDGGWNYSHACSNIPPAQRVRSSANHSSSVAEFSYAYSKADCQKTDPAIYRCPHERPLRRNGAAGLNGRNGRVAAIAGRGSFPYDRNGGR